MRVKDIEVGKVYAYRESDYSSLRQVKFLDGTGQLYTTGYRSSKFRKTTGRPGRSRVYGDTGYLVAIGPDVSAATLDDALVTGDVYATGRGFRYQVLVQTRFVLGLYDEVKAADDAAREADRQRCEKETAQRAEETARAETLRDALAQFGIHTSRGGWNGRMLELSPDNADKLVKMLRNGASGQ